MEHGRGSQALRLQGGTPQNTKGRLSDFSLSPDSHGTPTQLQFGGREGGPPEGQAALIRKAKIWNQLTENKLTNNDSMPCLFF